MKLNATLIGNLVKRTEPVYLGTYADFSYMDRPVTLKRINANNVVVTDDDFGYAAILGKEWLDDNWEQSDGSYKNLPQYDKYYHIKSASSIQKNTNETLETSMANRKSVTPDEYLKQHSRTEEYQKEFKKSIYEMERLAKDNLTLCYNGNTIQIDKCDERISMMLFMRYYTEYCNRKSLRNITNMLHDIFCNDEENGEHSEHDQNFGVELYRGDEFIARFTSEDPSQQYSPVYIHDYQDDTDDVLKIILDESLNDLVEGIHKLNVFGIHVVPDISVVPSAYDNKIFDIDLLFADLIARQYKMQDIDKESCYDYIIYACKDAYHLHVAENVGSVKFESVPMHEVADMTFNNSAILNEKDIKTLIKIMENSQE